VASNTKAPYILLTIYQDLYKQKYGKAITLNKFREKWGMQDVIDSVGFDRAKQLLEYYFHTQKGGHPLQFFFYNFDRMDNAITELDKDKERRRLLLEETKRMVEEGGM
jgi:hypothetical protein